VAERQGFSARDVDDMVRDLRMEVDHAFSKTMSFGIGPACSSLTDVRKSYDEAAITFDVGRSFGRESSTFRADDLGVYRILARTQNPALLDFVRRTLGKLEAYDREHHADLIRTLECVVETNFVYKEAAKLLVVHPHTLRYRLGRIGAVLGMDLGNPDRRLELHVALKLRKLLYPPSDKRKT
ncbi:MAG TPA: helix-turn-helix domain-containing protein, partial [Candidatus Limnocylindria bacterium]|nr:helix-turn-helix domain-containing protein [Candidatus Limnocylindria bacterium]